jgi:xanthine dehydrogenase molybdenum-binding subunit
MVEIDSVVGARLPRIDAPDKVTGSAIYAGDIKLPGMLHAKILQSPHAHARVKDVDFSALKNLPGVVTAICYKDVPRIPFATAGHPSDCTPNDTYIFDTKVRYVGEPVAAVAAESLEIAESALKLIKVEYEILPAVFNHFEALKPGAPKIHPDVENNNICDYNFDVGDAEKGFREADLVVEDELELQIVQHCTMETHGCVVNPEASGRLTIWSSTQIPFTLRRILSKALGISASKICVVKPHVGGGFGGKQDVCQETICAALALKAKRPVRLYYDREEDIVATRTRHSCTIRMKTGVKKDGTLTARQMDMYTNAGAYASHGPVVTIYAAVMWAPLYRCPNIKFKGKTIYTNLPIAGAFRGYGVPQAFYANERHFDNVAKQLGMDPLEFRLKNITKQGDIDPATKWVLNSCGIEECLRKGAEKIGWDERAYVKSEVKKKNKSKRRGYGFAAYTYGSGAAPYAQETTAATVKLNDDGSATLMLGSAEIGQGLETAFAQICAQELGVKYEDVVVFPGVNTDICPYDAGTYATRQTYIGGYAVKMAAEDAKQQIFKVAAEMLETTPDLLEAGGGEIWISGQESKRVSFYEVAQKLHYGRNPYQIIGKGTRNAVGNAPSFGAQFAEVEVDIETGNIEILRIVAAHDVGKIINPTTIEGQVDGGVAQGIGYALTEELKYDPETGEVLNASLRDYKLPIAASIPNIDYVFVETMEPTGPFGAKGIGEPATIPTAGAIANAVCDAIGIDINSIPITAEKVLSAINSKKV